MESLRVYSLFRKNYINKTEHNYKQILNKGFTKRDC